MQACPTITASLTGSTTICSGNSADLTFNFSAGAAPYDVTWTSGTISGIPNGNIESVSPTSTTTYSIISATDANGCTATIGSSATVTVQNIVNLGAVSGSTTVCENTSTAYSVPSVSGVSSYDWTVPPGALITGGQGTTSITINWNGASSGDVCVAATNGCGTGAPSCKTLTVNPVVVPPDPITGNQTVCTGAILPYSIPAVPGATTYNWTQPSGAVILSGQSTTDVTIRWNTASTGNLCVMASNSCNTSSPTCLTVTAVTPPTVPVFLSGNFSPCESSPNAVFSINNQASVADYQWTIPSGATIVAGQGTSSITINWLGAQSGDLCVDAISSTCNTTLTNCQVVNVVPIVSSPDPITGDQTVCTNIGLPFSIPPVPGATSYNWTVPAGAVILGGQGTTDVTIRWNTASTGNVCVRAQNTCGNSAYTCFSVSSVAAPTNPVFIAGGNYLPCENTELNYSVTPQTAYDTYDWMYDNGGSITSGQGTPSISIDWQGAGDGQLCVTASSSVCNVDHTSCKSVVVKPLPPAPVYISYDDVLCVGDTGIYVLQPISGVTSYNWTTNGGTILGSIGSTIKIHWTDEVFTTMQVSASNSCGTGPSIDEPTIVVSATPPQPGAVNGPAAVCQGSTQVYSIAPVPGAGTYAWTVPVGATILSGQGTVSVSVKFNNTGSGAVCVRAKTGTCESAASCRSVTVNLGGNIPGPISGPILVCQSSVASYSIAAVPGATGYSWTLPSGAALLSGNNTSSISVDFSAASSGQVCVMALSNCGASTPSCVSVGVTPALNPLIIGASTFCNGDSTILDAGQGYGTYLWSGGQTTQSISVLLAGTYTVTVTAGAGCSGTASQTVTVTNTLISGNCPAPAPVNAGPGCLASVSWQAPVFTNNCAPGSNLTVTSTHAPGAFFSFGITPVTYTATDLSGNTGTCFFNVEVIDNQAPVAKCKPVSAILGGTGTTVIMASQVDNNSTDNCFFTYSPSSWMFTCTELGSNTVVFKVVDAQGNTDTCIATVTIQDTIAPVLNCPSNVGVSAPAGMNSAMVSGLAPFTFSDNCGGPMLLSWQQSGATTGMGQGSADGAYLIGVSTVSYVATDAGGNTAGCLFSVTVEPTVVVDSVELYVDPSLTIKVLGDEFDVFIRANNFTNVGSMSYTFSYDTSLLKRLSIEFTAPFQSVGFDTTSFSNKITYTGTSFAGLSLPQGSAIAKMRFRATHKGISPVQLIPTPVVVEATDVIGDNLPVKISNGSVRIGPPDSLVLYIDSSLTEVTVGQTFDIYVRAKNFTSINTVQLSLQWDSGMIQELNVAPVNLAGVSALNFLQQVGDLGFSWTFPGFMETTMPDSDALFKVKFLALKKGVLVLSFSDFPAPRLVFTNFNAFPEILPAQYDNGTIIITCPPGNAAIVTPSGTQLTCALNNILLKASNADLYEWSGGLGTNQSINVSTPGTYTVTTTNTTSGCTATASTTITENHTIPDVSADNGGMLSCSNTNIALAGNSNTPGLNATWSGPNGFSATTWSTTATEPGDYTLTVSNPANGCTASFTTTVGGNSTQLLSSAGIVQPACAGQTGAVNLSITTGTPPYTFNWDNDAYDGQQNPAGMPSGIYACTISDGSGCTTALSAMIMAPTPLDLSSPVVTNINCAGQTNGAINLTTSGGTPGYTYLWSNGLQTEDLNNLAPGNYVVTVTDANGCNTTNSALVVEPAPLVLSAQQQTPANPATGQPGAAAITLTGGSPFYAYAWNSPGNGSGNGIWPAGGNYTLPNLAAGLYALNILDANGCAIAASFAITSCALSNSPVVQPASCVGKTDGSIALNLNGTPPYQITWSNPAFNGQNSVAGLPAGVYTVTVTESGSGCSQVLTYTVGTVPPIVFAQIVTDSVDCPGTATGVINLSLSGGTPPYFYDWSANAWDGMEDPGSLPAGTYTVTVSDAKSCTAGSSVITISEPTALTMNALQSQPAGSPGASDGVAILTLGGGSAPYQYTWNGPSTGTANAATAGNYTLPGLPVGSYTVTLTDAKGCSITSIFAITSCAMSVVANYTVVSCFGLADGAINLQPAGGTSPFGFDWNVDALDGQQNPGNLPAGTYTVTISEASSNCTTTASILINEPSVLIFNNLAEVCQPGNVNYKVFADVQGGTPPYLVTSGNGALNSTQLESIPFASGSAYGIEITDAHGCPALLLNGEHTCDCGTLSQSVDTSICTGGSVVFHQKTYSQPGLFQDTIPSVAGCDSIYFNLNISLKEVSVDLGPDRAVCGPKTLLLNAGVQNCIGCAFTWQPPGPNAPERQVMPVTDTQYSITAIDQRGCTATSTLWVDIQQDIQVTLDTTVCLNEGITVGTTTLYDPGQYKIGLHTSGGCDSLVVLNLKVVDPDSWAAKNDTLVLPFHKNEAYFPVLANDRYQPGWDLTLLTASAVADLGVVNQENIHYRLTKSDFIGMDSIYYRLCPVNGCPEACTDALLYVQVQDYAFDLAKAAIPNIITPGPEDEINSVFDPLGVFESFNIHIPVEKVTLSIVNRWGEVIVYQHPYVEGGWDGRTSTGKPAPQATYYYILKIDLGEVEYMRGPINLLR